MACAVRRARHRSPTVMRTILKESSDRTTLFKCSSEGEIDVSSDLTSVVLNPTSTLKL